MIGIQYSSNSITLSGDVLNMKTRDKETELLLTKTSINRTVYLTATGSASVI